MAISATSSSGTLPASKTLVDLFAGKPDRGQRGPFNRRESATEALLKDDLFERAKRLRNDVVADNLIPDTPTPKVHYEDIYDLRDAAERIVTDLFCGVRSRQAELSRLAGWDGRASQAFLGYL